MKLKEITFDDFFTKAHVDRIEWVSDKKPFLIYFSAAGCARCKMALPMMEKLHEQFNDKIDFYIADCSKDPDISTAFNVFNLPSLAIIDNKFSETNYFYAGSNVNEENIKAACISIIGDDANG